MMKKGNICATISFFLFLSVFSLFPAHNYFYPESIPQGGVLKVILTTDTDIKSLKGEIYKTDGTSLLYSEGFILTEKNDRNTGIILFGIPSNLAIGDYKIILSCKYGDGNYSTDDIIEVVSGLFPSEIINLDREMSVLRSSKNPLKAEQAKSLLDIYKTFNPESIYNCGSFIIPATGIESSAYGNIRTYIYSDGEKAFSIHTGMDIAADTGVPVYAGGAGKVVFAAIRVISGYTVVIEHLPGVYGVFFHLSKISVKVNDMVEKTREIGLIGDTGLATGSHLHWEIRVNGVPVELKQFLTFSLLEGNNKND